MWTLGPQVVECGGKAFQGQTRSSLLGIFVSDEEKKFHNTGARLRTPKIRYLS